VIFRKGGLKLGKPRNSLLELGLLALLGSLGGCQFFGDSYEAAVKFEKAGQSQQAIQAYQDYLKNHPNTDLGARITYHIAKNYAAQSDLNNAIHWYEKVASDYPHTDEELHALLDLATLYQQKLKTPTKAMEYAQRAFARYLENGQIRDAVQILVEAKYLTADALFTSKNFKGSAAELESLYKTFPAGFIAPDTQAKVDSLADRSRRALEIGKASVDLITLKSEIPFTKSYEGDFPPEITGEAKMLSPDGTYIAARKKGPNGVYYLYVAKVPAKGDEARFDLLKQTFGADRPTWSPDSKELVYWRSKKGYQKLEKTAVKTLVTQTLFYTKNNHLGIHPAYHPAGNKIAFTYAGRLCLVNIGDNTNKQLLKTNLKLDYTAELSWSSDGTLLRCRQTDKHGKVTDELLLLDVVGSSNI